MGIKAGGGALSGKKMLTDKCVGKHEAENHHPETIID